MQIVSGGSIDIGGTLITGTANLSGGTGGCTVVLSGGGSMTSGTLTLNGGTATSQLTGWGSESASGILMPFANPNGYSGTLGTGTGGCTVTLNDGSPPMTSGTLALSGGTAISQRMAGAANRPAESSCPMPTPTATLVL